MHQGRPVKRQRCWRGAVTSPSHSSGPLLVATRDTRPTAPRMPGTESKEHNQEAGLRRSARVGRPRGLCVADGAVCRSRPSMRHAAGRRALVGVRGRSFLFVARPAGVARSSVAAGRRCVCLVRTARGQQQRPCSWPPDPCAAPLAEAVARTPPPARCAPRRWPNKATARRRWAAMMIRALCQHPSSLPLAGGGTPSTHSGYTGRMESESHHISPTDVQRRANSVAPVAPAGESANRPRVARTRALALFRPTLSGPPAWSR